jgi:molybdopterin molybdotransferase
VSPLYTIDEALAAVLGRCERLPGERVDVRAAAGRVLAEDAVAAGDLPPFDSSAMDGYAVRAADTPGRLRVVGHSAAGHPAEGAVGAGEAIGISTGAVVPDGADAVVQVERVVEEDDAIVAEAVAQGANIRPRAGDASAGAVVAAAGQRLGPSQLGALAAAGVAHVSCGQRPGVVVLPTGSELRPPGSELVPGQIYESNSILLAAQAESAGAVVDVRPPALDDERELRSALEAALEVDVLLTSGGVSVGPHDLVRRLLAELGVEEVLWGVAVRPGKPLFFGVRGRTLVFGLPGNPVSTLVGFELFVRPALAALQGAADPAPAYQPGRIGTAARRNAARDELTRAVVRVEDGETVLYPLRGQESHMIVRAAAADALVLIPRGDGELEPGAHVSWLRV